MTYVSLMNKQGWQQCRGILGKLGRLNGKKIADEAGKSKVGMEQNSTCCSCPWRSIAVKGRNVDETLFIKQQQQQQNNSKRGRKKQTRASQQNDALLMRGYTVVSLSSMSYSSHYPGQLRQGKRKRQSQSKKKKDEMKGGVERKKKKRRVSFGAVFKVLSRNTTQYKNTEN